MVVGSNGYTAVIDGGQGGRTPPDEVDVHYYRLLLHKD